MKTGVDGPKRGARGDKSARRQGGGGERLYRGAVTGFSLVFVIVGLVVLGVTLANGGGPASVGVLMGLAFLIVGAGRLWVNARMGQ